MKKVKRCVTSLKNQQVKTIFLSKENYLSSVFKKGGFDYSEVVAQRRSVKKLFLEISQKFTGKHRTRASFLIKSQVRPATFFKKRLWHRCFPANFAKFPLTPFLKEHFRQLLLIISENSQQNVLIHAFFIRRRFFACASIFLLFFLTFISLFLLIFYCLYNQREKRH